MAKAKDIERDEAIARLREWVKPGDTLYTILRHVSASGMTRRISVKLVERKNGGGMMSDLTWNVAKACDYRVNSGRHEGLVVTGVGMDMGFAVVNDLSYVLYPTYKCVGKGRKHGDGCPSNAHVNSGPDRDKYGRGVVHSDSYALRQRWL